MKGSHFEEGCAEPLAPLALPDLGTLREQVSKIDLLMVSLLGARFALTRQIGEFKQAQDLPALDTSQEEKVLDNLQQRAEESGVSKELVEGIWTMIMERSVEEQKAAKRPLSGSGEVAA